MFNRVKIKDLNWEMDRLKREQEYNLERIRELNHTVQLLIARLGLKMTRYPETFKLEAVNK